MPILELIINSSLARPTPSTGKKEVLKAGDHGSTFGGNYLACAAANTVMDVLNSIKESGELDEMMIYFEQKVTALHQEYPELFLQSVGFGMMRGLRAKDADMLAEVEPQSPIDNIEAGEERKDSDNKKILEKEAEKEADIIVWDGGNNDLPFYKPNLHIVVADPHRPGHELKYHPGEVNLRMADVVVINKVDTAEPENIEKVEENVRAVNPKAIIIKAKSPMTVENPELIKDKRVLVIEDGPTLTHGGMPYGIGAIAAEKFGAKELIDPRPYAVGSIVEAYKKYTHLGPILPALGYGEQQIRELEETINRAPCEVVVVGTPIDLRKLIKIDRPAVYVRYELQEVGSPNLREILEERFPPK